MTAECWGLLTSLDDVKVLGVDVSVLGEVEVLLCDENALCGDRVSAYPYVQQSRESVRLCHSHGSVQSGILTSEEVPEEQLLAEFVRLTKCGGVKRSSSSRLDISCESPHLDCAAVLTGVRVD
jgi:hypothetical protein